MRFRIERITDCEFCNLKIDYGFYNTPVGEILIASTVRGICCIELADNRDEALQLLCKRFAKSSQQIHSTEFHNQALRFFNKDERMSSNEIVLHLYGTDFQIEVWRALLEIPFGNTSTYSDIAKAINKKFVRIKKDISLIDYIAECMGCEYISDLNFLDKI